MLSRVGVVRHRPASFREAMCVGAATFSPEQRAEPGQAAPGSRTRRRRNRVCACARPSGAIAAISPARPDSAQATVRKVGPPMQR